MKALCTNVRHNALNCAIAGIPQEEWCVPCLEDSKQRCQFCQRQTHTYEQLRECIASRRKEP